ncbi:MAG: RNA 2',3'-cyclic phosphodiesterase [Gemmatimonadota bacterium]|nr:RNA 2',3'-cyclic phosphodiesterase [Gemmatimonadota bacterium]MDE3013710.1 RNA 2',3'-cyclic phosphodiesterase [Gemmatimonadota bacterium]
MRLFVGINFPKKQREKMHRAARALREQDLPVRWVDPDNFHVTLKFLGEVRREQIDTVTAGIERAASSTQPFQAEIGGFGAYPTVRRPRVIWLGVEACPELRCLKQDLEWALGDAGFASETRSFHPHVTLGRARDSGGAGAFRELDGAFAALDFADKLKVRSIHLMRSHLTREGPHYTVVASARLGAK